MINSNDMTTSYGHQNFLSEHLWDLSFVPKSLHLLPNISFVILHKVYIYEGRSKLLSFRHVHEEDDNPAIHF